MTFPPRHYAGHSLRRIVTRLLSAIALAAALTIVPTVAFADTFTGTTGPDNITGTPGDDYIQGEPDVGFGEGDVEGADDTIDGLGGDDFIVGDGNGYGDVNGGNDTINGGDGNDTIIGDGDAYDGGDVNGGNDTINGGDGNDFIRGDGIAYGGGDVNGGDDVIHGGDGNDIIHGDGFSSSGSGSVDGGGTVNGGNDTLYGDAGDDTMFGDAGDDTMFGGAGNDTLFGGAGNDTLYGGDGDDILCGGDGHMPRNLADLLYGGAGNNLACAIDDAATVTAGEETTYDLAANDGRLDEEPPVTAARSTFALAAIDEELPLIYALCGELPTGIVGIIAPTTGLFTYTATQSGTVEYSVSRGELSSCANFLISVLASEVVPPAEEGGGQSRNATPPVSGATPIDIPVLPASGATPTGTQNAGTAVLPDTGADKNLSILAGLGIALLIGGTVSLAGARRQRMTAGVLTNR